MTFTKLISPGTTPDYWLYSVWNDEKVVASGFRNTEEEANKAADIVIKSLKKSPGFSRMKERLGPDAAEKMRLDTIQLQEAALASTRRPITGSVDKARDGAEPRKSGDHPDATGAKNEPLHRKRRR